MYMAIQLQHTGINLKQIQGMYLNEKKIDKQMSLHIIDRSVSIGKLHLLK